MESSRFESLALIAAVIGTAVLGGRLPGEAAAGDLLILLTLLAFDSPTVRSGIQSIAFSGVGAFCLLGPVVFAANNVLGALPAQGSPWMLLGLWLVLALILFGVDRFRMSSRENVTLAGSGLSTSGPMQPIVANNPAASYRPAPIRVEPVTPPPPPPVDFPTFLPTPAANFAAPVASAPVAAPPPPPSDVTAIPPGREAMIYLNLVGEGLNVLRTVRAENLGRDYYRIADVMPEGEQWEFTPGMVVRCRKKSLSNGKHMVAYEEAPRAL